jgi:hypothetical protein
MAKHKIIIMDRVKLQNTNHSPSASYSSKKNLVSEIDYTNPIHAKKI